MPVAVTEELGYTVFAFKMEVKPGEAKKVSLEYELPFTLNASPIDHYRLIVGHQAGADNILLTKTVKLEKKGEIAESYPQIPYAMPLTSSQIFLVALKSL